MNWCFIAMFIACPFQPIQAALGDTVMYDVTLNTQSLKTSDAAPFYLDFQLEGGNGNTVTIDQFNFGTGGFASDPSTIGTSGDASGSIASSVSLDSAGGYQDNELWQAFNPGDTVSFRITTTEILSSANPDGFFFNILDNTTYNIPTAGPNNEFLSLLYNTGNPGGGLSLSTYPNDPTAPPLGSPSQSPIGAIGAPDVSLASTVVPLPPTWAMAFSLMPLVVVQAWWDHRRRGGVVKRSRCRARALAE